MCRDAAEDKPAANEQTFMQLLLLIVSFDYSTTSSYSSSAYRPEPADRVWLPKPIIFISHHIIFSQPNEACLENELETQLATLCIAWL